MIRINKNLIAFAGLISLLGVSTLIVLQKLIPFAKHTSYYCQSLVNSFSMPISHYVGAIPFVLLFIFSAVAAIKLFIILIKAQFLKRNLIKKSRTDPSFSALLEKLQLTNKTYLVESNKQFAFCLGIRTPKIYISTALTSLLSIQEVEVVLRHERYHLENRDSLTMIIASIGESLLPFFPLLSDFLHNYRIEREIKADQEAILGLGDEKPLIAVLKKMLRTPSVAMVSVAAIADQDTLEPRILKLIKKETHFKKFKVKHVVVSVFSAFVMGAIVLSPVQAFEVHHQGQDVMMICPHGSLCMNACKQEYPTENPNHSEDILYSPMK
ncbi:hypothetical protein A2769_02015 [Candidatus Daviesbacteria bacterium RIFCSPHIGHO2_01_FULL_37_27]|nr:MAG: hypothetical protein A2769_02015 [Candidatus Daviesbacteria bacterium RIFCSPHIGHO2_01_FULL_37_27]